MKRIFNLICIAALFAGCTKNITEIQSDKHDFQSNQSEGSRNVEEVRSIALTAMEDFFPSQTKADSRHIESVAPFYGLTKSSSSDNTLFYIVNFENNEGFVLVGANTAAPEVIACVDKGNYDGGITPVDGFNMYIEDISAQLESISVSRIDIPTDPTAYITKPNDATTTVNPLVSVSWHQREPFNWYCPVISGVTTPTGCVATSIAQIMTVYEAPTSINLTYSNAHASNIALDWANMKDSQHSSFHNTTCQYCIQNAALLREIGERVDMDYDVDGSGAYSSKVKNGILSFGYACDDYTEYSFNSVFSSIKVNRPVYIDAAKADNSSAHAWVVDGSRYIRDEDLIYEVSSTSSKYVGKAGREDYYLHFNYGWGGTSDGYYIARRHEYGKGPTVYGGEYDNYPITMFTGTYTRNVGVITNIRPN